MKIINLSKGITVCLVNSDKFKTNFISVNFINALNKQTASQNALIPFVLKRGNESFKNLTEINERLNELYGASVNVGVRKKGDNQIISISTEFVDNSFAIDNEDIFKSITDFFISIIKNPILKENAFLSEYVEQEKKNLIDLIKSQINDKKSYAVNRCVEEMCKDEAYGVNEFGDIGEVSKINAVSLYESYQNLISNSKIFVFCEGQFEEEKLTEVFKNNFSSHSLMDIETKIIPNVTQPKEIVETLDVNQGKLTLGFRINLPLNEEQNIKIALFNEIFGGSPNSKLFENVREKLSLCYYCASKIERHKRIMIVYSGVENANKDLAFNEILSQLEEIKKGNITDFEMDAAKKSLYNKYISSEDSVMQTEDWYLGQYLSNGNISTLDAAKMLENMNVNDIVEVANSVTLDTVYFLKGNEGKNDEKSN